MDKTIIIMGVSGSGKTTIGQMLAKKLSRPFVDADDFHPEANKQKMATGTPLNDQDRLPWLEKLSSLLLDKPSIILACSALKKSYREILDSKGSVTWVYLKGDKEQILARMKARKNHFMKPEMLQSQLETLESPIEAISIPIDQSPEDIVETILQKFY